MSETTTTTNPDTSKPKPKRQARGRTVTELEDDDTDPRYVIQRRHIWRMEPCECTRECSCPSDGRLTMMITIVPTLQELCPPTATFSTKNLCIVV